jgi:hypothetical protein
LSRIFAERHKTGGTDLEAMEMALRVAVHQVGASALSALLQYEEPDKDHRQLPCPCGRTAQYVGLRAKTLVTALGRVELRRPYYRCAHCGEGQFPIDEELDVSQTRKSPAVRRMLATLGYDAPFKRCSQQMKLLAGVETTAKEVERTAEAIGEDLAAREQQEIQRALQLDLPVAVGEKVPILYVQMDATGVPLVKKETVGRSGKTEGQPAHTREAKLGCVFTQTTWDKEGYAVRDPDSTTYTGAIETAEEFGKRLYLEAWKRGWGRAEKQVVMGDGAEWIWNIAEEHFAGAVQIVDLYHAREHLWDLARKLRPEDGAEQKRWMMIHQDMLDEGKIEKLVSSLRSMNPTHAELTKTIDKEAEYFAKNAERMRYSEFRRQHLFVGSGVIEAGCKTLIGSRCKGSGMFWTVRGANAILALRCCHSNRRFEDYWEARRA